MATNSIPIKSRAKPITTEVATAQKDLDLFTGWLGRMENPDLVLRYESAGKGVKLYEELQRDWQVFAMLQTRILALQACEWQVEPATDKRADQKVADFVEQVLKSANFDALTGQLMEAIITGYKPSEIMWDVSEGDVWISEFRGRRASRFLFDMDYRLKLLTPSNMIEGELVPDRKFITWSYGGGEFNPYGRGLGWQLYWPWWFKKNGVKFWMVFAEKFGSPTPVGKYPPGMEGQKQTLLDAIGALQQETGVVIPEGMVIELLEGERTSAINTYQDLCDYMDRAIAKVILGQTLTSESGDKGSGSYALGKVHNEVRRELLKADADSICELINQTLVRWIVDYNFPAMLTDRTGALQSGRGRYPRIWRRTDPEQDLKPLAERDKILLVDMGLAKRVPESYIEDTYGIPLAKAGEPTIQVPEPVDAGIDGQGDAGTRRRGEGETGDEEALVDMAEPATDKVDRKAIVAQANLERMESNAVSAAADEMEIMLRPLLDFMESATSLEDVGERIHELYPHLDSRRFQELLQRAMFASELIGYGSNK